MKYLILIFSFVLSAFCHAQDTTKVLFIGNSFTFANDLPQTFYQLANKAGKTVYVDNITMGGATLQMHLQNQATLQKINEKHWDFVILQEQSQIPSFIPERETMMYPYVIALDSIIHTNWLCTRTLFFMTWAHKYGDMGILQNGGTDSYEDMQQRLRSGYMTIADTLDAAVAPCGWAWRQLIQSYPSLELYSSDNYHPAENGTYLAACTFFASIFEQTAVGINYLGNISQSDATIFQSVASQIVLDSLGLWNIGLYNPKPIANFGYLQSGNQFHFSDSSSLTNDYKWDFGDGTSSVLQNPTHTYVTNGTYNIQLISRNSCDADTITKTIQYLSTSINYTEANRFVIYPNPTSDKISIESTENEIIKKIVITQMDGKQVYFDENEHIKINELTLSNLKKGIYNLIIYTNESSFTKKIVIL
jgi:PKD repeat protein